MKRNHPDTLVFTGTIMAKPRMTKSDKWNQRPATSKYWAFKDLLTLQARIQGFVLSDQIKIVAHLPMPKSWSKKKRAEFVWEPHQQKPDIDNILKSVQDILMKEDSTIWDVHILKYWTDAPEGTLIIKNVQDAIQIQE